MAPNIYVIWDNSSVVYFPGQPITGRVQVNSDKYVTARSINIKFKGFSKVHWTEQETRGHGDDRKTETVNYDSYEEYYKAKYGLWGDGQNHNQLPPGNHTFNFSFILPYNSPSSFRSEYGKVQHELEVKIDVPMGFDIKKRFPYSVNDIYDLNRDQQALVPIEANKHKTVCCLCCRSGPISFVLRIPRSGYVPGEAILINAECTNMSDRLVNDSKVKIVQKVTHHANGKRKESSRKIAEKYHPQIEAGESDIWSGEQLLVPALPPSYLQHCHNINITYVLEFTLNISGTLLNLSTEAPLIIGSIPLQQYFNSFSQIPVLPQYNTTVPNAPPPYTPMLGPPLPPQHMPAPGPIMPNYPVPGQPVPQPVNDYVMPGQPMPPAYNPDYVPNSNIPESSTTVIPSAPAFPGMQEYPNMPPPTYSQCVFGLTKHDDDDDDFEFVPRYVSYGLHNPQQNAAGNWGTGGTAVVGEYDYSNNDKKRLI